MEKSKATKTMGIIISWLITIAAIIGSMLTIYPTHHKTAIFLTIALIISTLLYSIFYARDYINYYGKPQIIIGKTRKLRLAINNCYQYQMMAQGWGAAFQKVIDETKKLKVSIFKNDAKEILELSSKLDKRGIGKDGFDVWCRPDYVDFKMSAGNLFILLERQLKR